MQMDQYRDAIKKVVIWKKEKLRGGLYSNYCSPLDTDGEDLELILLNKRDYDILSEFSALTVKYDGKKKIVKHLIKNVNIINKLLELHISWWKIESFETEISSYLYYNDNTSAGGTYVRLRSPETVQTPIQREHDCEIPIDLSKSCLVL